MESAGVKTMVRECGQAGARPVLFLHGVPTSSYDWLPFLPPTSGFARAIAPDLPGFGRSQRPRRFDYSAPGYAGWVEGLVEGLGLEGPLTLVGHDWGLPPLLGFAAAHPERVERIVALNGVPLSGEYRWHRIARIWRTPLLGEAFMVTATKPAARLLLRQAGTTPLPDDFVDEVWRHFDRGTQHAILRLYRASPPGELERLSIGLDRIGAEVLILWADRDPYIPAPMAEALAAKLSGARVQVSHVPDAGHWSWLDRPDLVDRTVAFVRAAR